MRRKSFREEQRVIMRVRGGREREIAKETDMREREKEKKRERDREREIDRERERERDRDIER